MKKISFSADKPFFCERSTGPLAEDGAAKRTSSHHVHNRIELYYLEEGLCNYFIGGKSYTVKKGDLVIIPKGTIHRTTYTGEQRTRTVINCTSKYVPASVMPHLTSIMPLYRNDATKDEIADIFARIERDYTARDEFSDDAILSRMHLLFYLIVRNIRGAEGVAPRKLSADGVIKYIGAHFSEDISLSSVAREFSLSPEYLSRLFKKECGFGFSEYLSATRLSAARDLLMREPSMTVSKAAFACGYSDSNYFSTCFKREYGTSPKSFRAEKGASL